MTYKEEGAVICGVHLGSVCDQATGLVTRDHILVEWTRCTAVRVRDLTRSRIQW